MFGQRFKISAQDAAGAEQSESGGATRVGGEGTRNVARRMLIDKNGVLCRHMNMNQNGTHKSFRQTSALTTLLSTHTHTHTHLAGKSARTACCVLHISNGSACWQWRWRWATLFVINPLKVKDKIHVACLLMHTDTHRHVHTRTPGGRQTETETEPETQPLAAHKVALINETH